MFLDAQDLKGPEKLATVRRVRSEIERIEDAARTDFNFPLYEIKAAQAMLQDVDASISRLEAGARRSAEAKLYREQIAAAKRSMR